MPRDLGQAKRADLTGHFPGEPSEQVSSLTQFLVGASQIAPPADGTFFGNGKHDTDTEVSGRQTEAHSRTDTEVAGRLHPGGNGHSHAHDTVFDSPLPTLDMDDAMSPEPLLAPEPMLSPEPLEPAPAGPPKLGAATEALRPPNVPGPASLPPASAPELIAAEPEALESIPDLTSPENDVPQADEEEGAEPVTDKLPPRTRAEQPRDLPPPASAGDTGMLTMEAEVMSADDQLTVEELRQDDDTNLQVGLDPSEKITSKVEPRVDVDPRSRDPEAVVRDTVNFYNQTQSLHQRQAPGQAMPTVAGTVPLAPRPREFEDSPSRRFTPPPPMPSLKAEPESLPEPMGFGSDDLLAPDAMAAPELSAAEDINSADRKDTDKFLEDDRRPPDLPKPMGQEKPVVASVRRAAAGQPSELEAVAPEKVAAGKDTQKFFVADILRKKEEAGSDSTAELVPDVQPTPSGESSTDTAFEVATENPPTVREPRLEPADELPDHTTVEKDFDTRYLGESSERITPEYEGVPEEARGQLTPDDQDDLDGTDSAPDQPVDRITEKVTKAADPAPTRPATRPATAASGRPSIASSAGRMPASVSATGPASRPLPAVAAQRAKGPRVSDEVSRRLAAESQATLKLLDTAEQLATRLRLASEQSRTDLLAISARRRAAPMPELEGEPEPAANTDSEATRVMSARDYALDERPTTPVPGPEQTRFPEPEPEPEPAPAPLSRRFDRVPTQAIGDIVSAIESKLDGESAPLSELLQEASRRITQRIEAEDGGNGNGHHDHDDDLDHLVAASASLRAVIEADNEADRAPEDDPRGESARPPGSARVVAESPLAQDLDRMWKELSTRKAAVVSTVEPTRPSQRRELGPGWTQEALWKTLAGISLVTFVLGGFFVWIVYKLLS